MKICFLSRFNPSNHRCWSGICYQMYDGLGKYHQLEWIGAEKLDLWLRILIKINEELDKKRNKKRGYPYFNKLICILKARNVDRVLRHSNYDFIFAANAPDYIAYLKTKIPVIYVRDTTFQLFLNYYPTFYGLKDKEIREGNEIENRAIEKAKYIVYSSTWAAESAITYYGADKDKIRIVDFGANLLFAPSKEEISLLTSNEEVCNLLFVGINWIRKGGDLAYKTFLQLRREGFRCKLTIVGCNPELEEGAEDITIVPFLNKQDKHEFQKLYNIYLKSHILLLPTRADCTPVVFSEAAAFGIPVITTNTGGIASVVREGVNGYLMPLSSDKNHYSQKVKSVFKNVESYNLLRINSRKEFESRLSWNVWLYKINELMFENNSD